METFVNDSSEVESQISLWIILHENILCEIFNITPATSESLIHVQNPTDSADRARSPYFGRIRALLKDVKLTVLSPKIDLKAIFERLRAFYI